MGEKLVLVGAVVLAVPVAVMAMLFAFVWLNGIPDTPRLSQAQAARLISAAPEFNGSRQLVRVSNTQRSPKSLSDSGYYMAEFDFTARGSTAPIPATAEYRYDCGSWHLAGFRSGDPPVDVPVAHVSGFDCPGAGR